MTDECGTWYLAVAVPAIIIVLGLGVLWFFDWLMSL